QRGRALPTHAGPPPAVWGRARRPPRPGPRRWCGNRGRRNSGRIDGAGADHATGPRARAAADPPGVGGGRRRQPHRGRAGWSELRGHADPAYAGGDDARPARAGPGDEHRGGRDRQVSRTIARPAGGDMTAFSAIEEGIEEIRQGRLLLVVDDEDRENEGDLVMAAEKVTPEAVNFMAKHGRGLICVPLLG